MQNLEETCASLRTQIAATEAQLASLKRDLADAEKAAAAKSDNPDFAENQNEGPKNRTSPWPLLQEEYRRYGRQMIVSQIGLEGELGSGRDLGTARLKGLRLTLAVSLLNRSTQVAFGQGATCWSRWSGLSCSSVPCWSWSGHSGAH